MLNENELVEIINNIYYYLYINNLEGDIYERKRSILLLCALLIIALILPCSGSEAASKLTKKQKATYKKCLDKYFYKTNGKSLKFKYYYKGKLRSKST